MSAMQRRKGAAGERELIGLLRDRLGDLPGLRRNLEQYRSSGADFTVGGHAVECKRAEKFRAEWLDQAERQAGDDVPVLAWRRNGGRWRFLLLLDLDGFAEVVREAVSTAAVAQDVATLRGEGSMQNYESAPLLPDAGGATSDG